MAEVAYAPTDVLKPVAEDVWLVDSGPMHVGPMQIPIRMTVLRLADGSLLLHSPTRFTFPLRVELEKLGPIRHLVAPNTAHWTFAEGWQTHVPEAQCWAVPGLKARPAVQKSGLRIDHEITEPAPVQWGDTVETVLVPGAGLVEAALFHRPSRTLVLTDLVVNVEPEKLPTFEAMAAKLVGATAPDGRAPIYARLAVWAKRDESREAGRRVLALEPERVIFAHGKWFESDGAAELRRALDWLVR